jgi:hypothetical protein
MTHCYITLGGSSAEETATAREKLKPVFEMLHGNMTEPETPLASFTDDIIKGGWRHLRTLEVDLPDRHKPNMIMFAAVAEAGLRAEIKPDLGRVLGSAGKCDALYVLLNPAR